MYNISVDVHVCVHVCLHVHVHVTLLPDDIHSHVHVCVCGLVGETQGRNPGNVPPLK